MKVYLILVIAYISCLDARGMSEHDIFNEFSGEEIMLVCNYIKNGDVDEMMKHTESFLEIKEMCDFLAYSMGQGTGNGMKLVPSSKTPRSW